MAVEVILTIASRGCSIFGSGTSSIRTSPLPCQQSAFIVSLLRPSESRQSKSGAHPAARDLAAYLQSEFHAAEVRRNLMAEADWRAPKPLRLLVCGCVLAGGTPTMLREMECAIGIRQRSRVARCLVTPSRLPPQDLRPDRPQRRRQGQRRAELGRQEVEIAGAYRAVAVEVAGGRALVGLAEVARKEVEVAGADGAVAVGIAHEVAEGEYRRGE